MEILIITGMSGAGKSSAAAYLEDMGFYTVDNIPADIILKFAAFCAESDGRYDRVALVSDIRGGDDRFGALLGAIDTLRTDGVPCRLLFLDADVGTIIKRYKETRRRHPLQEDGLSIEQAVSREAALLQPLRERADVLINTASLPTAKLKSELAMQFGQGGQREGLSVNVLSFGYKHGVPLEADLVFDVRFMPNPFYIPALREKTGMDDEVYHYVLGFPQAQEFLRQVEKLLAFLLPLYHDEGKTMLVIAVGCTGGHHRSVTIARCLSDYIRRLGYPTSESHRDMTRG